jgi:hypothetical protein
MAEMPISQCGSREVNAGMPPEVSVSGGVRVKGTRIPVGADSVSSLDLEFA